MKIPFRFKEFRYLAMVLLAGIPGMLPAVPSMKGDLDEDGQYTVRDVVRIVNHLQQIEFMHPLIQPFADIDSDGDIDGDDVTALIDVVLEKSQISDIPVGFPIETSPFRFEDNVSLTRETVVRFSLPIADDVSLTTDDFFASFGGQKILSRVEISQDRLKASLFYLENLPASARISVTMLSDNLRDNLGRQMDLDTDGQEGGSLRLDFDTVSISPVPQTGIIGTVFAAEKNPDGSNIPLPGVIIEVVGDEENTRAVTAPDGTFSLSPVPAGEFFVNIDGRPVTGEYPDGAYYPFLGKVWKAVGGKMDNLAAGTGIIFLPFICPGTLTITSPVVETTVEFPQDVLDQNADLAGTEIVIPPNSLFANDGTRGGRVGIAPVPPERLPEPLPTGLDLPLVITIQTDGATNFDIPAPVRLPNLPDARTGQPLPPGARTALWSFDHDIGDWEIAGPMHVTADGKWIVTDAGVGVRQPGWHGSAPGASGGGGDPNPGGGDGPGGDGPGGDGPGGDGPGGDGPGGDGPGGDGPGGDGPGGDGPDEDENGPEDPNNPFNPGDDDDDDDDDDPPGGEECDTTCIEAGSLSDGTVTLNKQILCISDTVVFTASGVEDTGGRKRIVCRDAEGNVTRDEEVPDPASNVFYRWTIFFNGTAVRRGAGTTASMIVTRPGAYTARFEAGVRRECLEQVVQLAGPVATVVGEDVWESVTLAVQTPNIRPLVDRLQAIVNRIPRINVQLTTSTAFLSHGRRDCCAGERYVENGETYTSGQYAISGGVDATIWGVPKVTKSFDWGIAGGTLTFGAGVYVRTELRFVGTGGRRTSECLPAANCGFADIGSDVRIIPNLSVTVKAFVKAFGRTYELADITVTPAAIVIPIQARIRWNSRDACDGFGGTVTLGDIRFRATFTVGPVSIFYERVIFRGGVSAI